jgi:hypothetical protein
MKKKILLSLVAIVAVAGGVAAMSAFEAHIINVTAIIENALSVSPPEIEFGTVFPQEKLYQPLTIALSSSFLGEDRVDDVGYMIHQKPKPKTPEDREYCLEHSENLERCYPSLCPVLSKLPDELPEPENYKANDKGISVPHPDPECSDGEDNDGDGFIDFPEDQECFSANDDDEMYPGDMPQVFGYLAKSIGDTEDTWTIDLVVPCFEGMCEQGYVGPTLDSALEGQIFGCDLWVEVVGISTITGDILKCYDKCKYHLKDGNPARYAGCWWACVLGLIDP